MEGQMSNNVCRGCSFEIDLSIIDPILGWKSRPSVSSHNEDRKIGRIRLFQDEH